MKKQLLILLMAFFAIGMTSAYGQVTCPAPRAVDITCLPSDAIHPVPGTLYDYTVTVPTPPGTKEYLWFVTTDPNFITAGALTLSREIAGGTYLSFTGAGYNNAGTGTATIQLVWKYFDPTIPVFVVIQVRNDDGTCNTQNMKVYKILPLNGFTLDITNVSETGVTQAGYGTNIDHCVHNIVSATYDAVLPGVVYDFGLDTLYYVVTAANFTTSWLPSVEITRDFSATGGDMGEVVDVSWARPGAFPIGVWNAMPLAGTVYTSTNPVVALDPTGGVGPLGECIVIRVVIDHSTTTSYEGIIAEQIKVAVDGQTNLSAAPADWLGDIHYSSTLPTPNALCGLEDGFTFDYALQTITPRPNIIDATPPAGDDFLPIEP